MGAPGVIPSYSHVWVMHPPRGGACNGHARAHDARHHAAGPHAAEGRQAGVRLYARTDERPWGANGRVRTGTANTCLTMLRLSILNPTHGPAAPCACLEGAP